MDTDDNFTATLLMDDADAGADADASLSFRIDTDDDRGVPETAEDGDDGNRHQRHHSILYQDTPPAGPQQRQQQRQQQQALQTFSSSPSAAEYRPFTPPPASSAGRFGQPHQHPLPRPFHSSPVRQMSMSLQQQQQRGVRGGLPTGGRPGSLSVSGGGGGGIGTMSGRGGQSRGLKEQEKLIADLKKDNFGLKMRVVTLQEHLESTTPENVAECVQENVELRVQVERLREDLMQLRQEREQQPVADMKTIHAVGEQLAETQDLVETYRHQLEDKTKVIDAQHLQLEQLHAENIRVTDLLAHTRHELSATSDAKADTVQKTVVAYRDQLTSLESELTDTKSKLFQANAQLAQRAVEVEKLRGELESVRLLQSQNENSAANQTPNNRSFIDQSFMSAMSFDPTAHQTISSNQLEQGITMLRDQISEMRMQLIDKQSNADRLMMELENKSTLHTRSLQQIMDEHGKEKQRLQSFIDEKQSQLSAVKAELAMCMQKLEQAANGRHSDETSLQMQIQTLEQRNAARTSALHAAEEKLEQIMSQLRTNEASVAVKGQHIDNLTAQLEGKNRLLADMEREHKHTVDNLQSQLHQSSTKLSAMTVETQSKDNEISLLRGQISGHRQQLVDIEERWAKQSREHSDEELRVRARLDEEIASFKAKTESMSETIARRNAELKELRDQMDMHSVGLEASNKQFSAEKSRMAQECQKLQLEVERLKVEAVKLRGEIEHVQGQYREAVAVNERLAFAIQDQDEQAAAHKTVHEKLQTRMREKEAELRESAQKVSQLTSKLDTTQLAMDESRRIAEMTQQRCDRSINERNELLLQVDRAITNAFHSAGIELNHKVNPNEVSDNFSVFAERLRQHANNTGRLFNTFVGKLERAEQRMDAATKSWHSKLDGQLAQMSSFEHMLQQLVQVQNRHRQALQQKREQLHAAQMAAQTAQHDSAAKQHELSTLQTRLTHVTEREQAKAAELRAKVAELERQVKDRDSHCKQVESKCDAVRQQLVSVQHSSSQTLQQQTESLRLARIELEASQRQCDQLEAMLRSQKQAQSLLQSSGSAHLLATSESALGKLNESLQRDLRDRNEQLDRYRRLVKQRDQDVAQLQTDVQTLKGRLDKRERIINMALAKLELVNKRKDSVEHAIQLHKHRDDISFIRSDGGSEKEKSNGVRPS